MDRKWILVVDDDQGILDAFDAMLGDDFYVCYANNGFDAKILIERIKPGLIFLDLKMPGISGMNVLKWIKEKDLDAHIVIITALPQNTYEDEAWRSGIIEYLRKPFEVKDVENIVVTNCFKKGCFDSEVNQHLPGIYK